MKPNTLRSSPSTPVDVVSSTTALHRELKDNCDKTNDVRSRLLKMIVANEKQRKSPPNPSSAPR